MKQVGEVEDFRCNFSRKYRVEEVETLQSWEAAKPSWNRGPIEVTGSKVKPSQVGKEEKGTIGMDDAKEPAATEVQPNYMACHLIIGDPIPWVAITTLLPRLCFGITHDTIIMAIRRTGIVDREWLLKVEQSKGLVMRAQFGWIREREKRRKKRRAGEKEKRTEEEERFRHHSSQSNWEWIDERNGYEYTPIYVQMIHSGKLLGNPKKTFLVTISITLIVVSFQSEPACYDFSC